MTLRALEHLVIVDATRVSMYFHTPIGPSPKAIVDGDR